MADARLEAKLFSDALLSALLAPGRIVMNEYVFSVTEIENGHRLHIIRGNEEQTLDVMNGQKGDPGKGEPGMSPTVEVTEIEGGHRVTITDANGRQSFDVLNGEGGLSKIPVATPDALGGVKIGKNLKIDADGVISVDTADAVEKDNTRPITSAAVHTTIGNIEILLSTI